jgi:LuxR family quorum-sensing transcriptional regulator LasR
MKDMRICHILSSSGAADENCLKGAMGDISRALGFDYYHYCGEFARDQRNGIPKTLFNFPIGWVNLYGHMRSDRVDPIFKHSLFHATPIIWRDLCTASRPPEKNDFSDNLFNNQLGDGASIPIQTKNGDSAILSFANRADRGDTQEIVARALPEACLAAIMLHDVVRQMVANERNVLQAPLTPRELECLHWIALGKSNWEIARILDVTEHGVVYYVRKLLWKLDARSRHQAVRRATACGLL